MELKSWKHSNFLMSFITNSSSIHLLDNNSKFQYCPLNFSVLIPISLRCQSYQVNFLMNAFLESWFSDVVFNRIIPCLKSHLARTWMKISYENYFPLSSFFVSRLHHERLFSSRWSCSIVLINSFIDLQYRILIYFLR